MDHHDELATPADAMREYAQNVGDHLDAIGSAWILTDYDVWVVNPHYRGPRQPHPESQDDEGCRTCGETGIDPNRAAQSLAIPGFNDYIAAMYPCPDCRGAGR